MRLTETEKLALMDWVEEQTHASFDHFLFRTVGVRTDVFAGPHSNILTVAVEFIGWLNRNGEAAPKVFAALVRTFPEHALIGVFRDASARMAASAAREAAAGERYEACLAGRVPVIDRAPLRQRLRALADGQSPPVVVVEGEAGMGRSHSWFLIQHVAAGLPDVRALNVDLMGPVLPNRDVATLFNHLVRLLNLPDGAAPAVVGVSGVTLAARFAGELVTRIQAMQQPWPRTVWLVFDNLDRPVPPEVKLFVSELAQARMQDLFTGCTLILLAPDPLFGVPDPGRVALREQLTTFLSEDIATAARSLNALGASPLPADELDTTIAGIVGDATARQGRDHCQAVAEAFRGLRDRVQA